jgi:hypothetical protein
MNKAKIVLIIICLFAGLGAAVAFKARLTTGFIKTGPLANQYSFVQVSENCVGVGPGCLFTNVMGITYQLYQKSGLYYYYPIKE